MPCLRAETTCEMSLRRATHAEGAFIGVEPEFVSAEVSSLVEVEAPRKTRRLPIDDPLSAGPLIAGQEQVALHVEREGPACTGASSSGSICVLVIDPFQLF